MSKRIIVAALTALLLASLAAQTRRSVQSPHIVFNHVTVIDMNGGAPKAGMTVVVAGDRIAALGPVGSVRVPKGARVIDASGKYLIPGLWDTHVHLWRLEESTLLVFLANGVTSVRDMGGGLDKVKAWRDEVRAGTLAGPRIRTAGTILEDARWLEAVLNISRQIGDAEGLRVISERIGVTGPEDARRAVASLARRGVDFIKIRTVASPETFTAIMTAAKRHGLPVAAHAPLRGGRDPVMDLTRAAAAGLKSVEHAETVSLALGGQSAAAAGKEFARHGTWYTPTIVAQLNWRVTPADVTNAQIADAEGNRDPRNRYVPDSLRGHWRWQMSLRQYEQEQDWATENRRQMEELRAMGRAGAGLFAGTDVSAVLVYPGFSLHDELELLVSQGGLTPFEALQSATRNPPHFFDLQQQFGTVERGKIADLVLLDADPLEDIRNTKRINAVVVNGRLLDRSALDSLLSQADQTKSRRD
jgi:imidazolonepropionase-like amidohydrolase